MLYYTFHSVTSSLFSLMATSYTPLLQVLEESYPLHFHPTHRWGYLVPIASKHQREHKGYGPLKWSDEVFGDDKRYNYFKLPNPVRNRTFWFYSMDKISPCAALAAGTDQQLWQSLCQGLHGIHGQGALALRRWIGTRRNCLLDSILLSNAMVTPGPQSTGERKSLFLLELGAAACT
jgi:hypothetical protein